MNAVKLLVLGACLVVAGCATTNEEEPTRACVSGSSSGFGVFPFSRAVSVDVTEIDGEPRKGRGPFCVSAGVHRLRVKGKVGTLNFHNFVHLDLEAGGRYRIDGQLGYDEVAFQLMDVSKTPEVVRAEFDLVLTSVDRDVPATIVIPIRIRR